MPCNTWETEFTQGGKAFGIYFYVRKLRSQVNFLLAMAARTECDALAFSDTAREMRATPAVAKSMGRQHTVRNGCFDFK
jgi:hypothetical protein